MTAGSAIFFDQPSGRWLLYSQPLRVLAARSPAEVLPTLEAVEKAVEGEGCHAAGLVSYEAAPAFDSACTVRDPGAFPLLWFGLYPPPTLIELPPPAVTPPLVWEPALSAEDFSRAVAAIKQEIAAGASYQVNLTFPLRAAAPADPFAFFCALAGGQRARGAAYLDLGRFVVCSASPELFFAREGEQLTVRPMKGTAARGLTAAADRACGLGLAASIKDRAENLMILDMLRNDLARLGGAVEVPELFTVEKYPTLWQMTSSAATRTEQSLAEVFTALFPCASITGAPKLSTMAIIAGLEDGPRRVYTGAIGRLAPGRRASFAVAIRTALIDRDNQDVEYRVGAGITWDSESASEYAECLAKARILTRPQPDFALLESLRWTADEGYWLLEEHLQRLAGSADYFDFPWQRQEILARLSAVAAGLPLRPHKLRLLLGADGGIRTEAALLEPNPEQPLRLGLAAAPIDPSDPFLYHKTSHRRLYQAARDSARDCDEVLLWNTAGAVTEALTANLVAEIDRRLVTPPLVCGLLPGTLRSRLLADGIIAEAEVTRGDLRRAERLWLINGVRGWRPAVLAAAGQGSAWEMLKR